MTISDSVWYLFVKLTSQSGERNRQESLLPDVDVGSWNGEGAHKRRRPFVHDSKLRVAVVLLSVGWPLDDAEFLSCLWWFLGLGGSLWLGSVDLTMVFFAVFLTEGLFHLSKIEILLHTITRNSPLYYFNTNDPWSSSSLKFPQSMPIHFLIFSF